MIGVFLVLPIVAMLLMLPGFIYYDRTTRQPRWLLALPLIGVGIWLGLVSMGVRPKSLSNIIEPFGIALTAVGLGYAKFWVLDRMHVSDRRSTLIILVTFGAVVFGAFLFIPLLPE